ncbi:hypothetical protein SAMN05428989_4039 [Pseudoxanthomonas sp. GM95]|uniref:hypothetical protein n=1 Tax=Pseudoxanthomonas sp. GM95 TaxID=1881043 RepID=UPI0008BEE4DD|nr:hypothetical protein [Pseudoxanthomonas sp. GM95]SEM54513.1 hypothetical protein SAMN05428989_4039 [Pseudoxanthomonas sp. GM95]
MTDRITCVFELEIIEGKLEGFKEIIRGAVEATSTELTTLLYEYSISDDGKSAHIIERYLASGVVSHVDQTFAPFAQPFIDHVRFAKLTVYGEPDAEIRKRLDPFGAIYMKPFKGFDRFQA